MSDKATQESQQQPSIRVGRATGVVSFFTLLSRILGLIRDMVIATAFGAGFATDAFFVAFKVPNLLRRLVAEGSLSTAFVPVFTDELKESESAARRAVAAVTSFTLILTSVLALLGIIFADELTFVFAPGFGIGSAKSELAASLMQIMFPYIVLVSLLALFTSVLNSIGHFAWPAFAPALLNIVLIIAVLFFSDNFASPVYVLAWGVVAGGLFALLPQFFVLKKRGFLVRPRSPFGERSVRILGRLMIPAILSASVYQITVFINTLLASLLQEGSVSWLYYADRIFQFPLGVFTLAVATAVLPRLSQLASRGDQQQVNVQLRTALEWVSIISLPASAGLIVLATPIVALIYGRGSFSADDVARTSLALVAYSVGLWSISCQSILVRAFLAKKNTFVPAMISLATLLVNLCLALSLMGPPKSEAPSSVDAVILWYQGFAELGALEHMGLALASSLASFVSFALLLFMLRRINTSIELYPFAVLLVKTLFATVFMMFFIEGLKDFGLSPLILLLTAIPTSAILYFCILHLLKVPHIRQILARA